MDSKEFLQHVGVLGMHWGRRKGMTGNTSEDHQKKMSLKKKKLSEMSNAELKALNERMQLERNYKDLNQKDIGRGRKFINELIGNTTKELAKDYLKKGINKGGETIIKRVSKGKR